MGILALPLGFIMEWIFIFVKDYGWTLILFTVLARVLMFPLNIKQQKSMARMSAFNPMMQEIQKKYANNKEKQNEEMMKFQQENGFSMTAGCMPMLVQMLVMFGMIEVIYRPLQYILRIGKETIDAAIALVPSIVTTKAGAENLLIEAVQNTPAMFAEVLGEHLPAVQVFDMDFYGLSLAAIPNLANWTTYILPSLAVITMILSQVLVMRTSGQTTEQQSAMKWMPWVMSVTFGWFCFTVPVGFSIYYTTSNLLQIVQSMVLKKMFDPEKIKAEVEAEIAARKAEKKTKKQVTIKTETGDVVEKEVSESELARIRLAKARELDAEKYQD